MGQKENATLKRSKAIRNEFPLGSETLAKVQTSAANVCYVQNYNILLLYLKE